MSAMVWLCDTVTGEKLEPVAAQTSSGSRMLSAAASGRTDVVLDGSLTVPELRERFQPWRRMLVIERDGVPQYAGIIIKPSRSGNVLSLATEDIWSIWQRRLAVDHGHPHIEQWKVTYSGTSLRTLAKRAVQLGTDGPPVPTLLLPVTLEADVPGGLAETWYGHHLSMVADVLTGLTERGLDIDFRPRWVNGKLDLQMVTSFPTVVSAEWFYNADSGNVADLTDDANGAVMANNVLVVGEGSEEKTLIRSERDRSSTLPLLELIDDRKTVSDPAVAAAYASEGLRQRSVAAEQYTLTVPAADAVNVRPGDVHRIFFSADPWSDDSTFHERRVVRVDPDLTDQVKISYQATGVQ